MNVNDSPRTFHIIPDEDALGKCAWCSGKIHDESEVYSLGVKVRQEIALKEYERHCIEITLASEEKALNALVATEDSEAKKAHMDLLFLVCCESCADTLKEVLEKEISKGDLIEGVQY